MSRRIVCTLACLVPLTVAGIDILAVHVTRESSRYHLEVEARLAATPAAVLARLLDFERYEKINPTLREATVLAVGSRTRVRLITEACFWFFCRRMTHVQDFVVEPDGLRARVVPGLSDFRSGAMVWEVVGDGLRSRLQMHGHMEPDFAVAPLFGPFLERHALSTLTGNALSGSSMRPCIRRFSSRPNDVRSTPGLVCLPPRPDTHEREQAAAASAGSRRGQGSPAALRGPAARRRAPSLTRRVPDLGCHRCRRWH